MLLSHYEVGELARRADETVTLNGFVNFFHSAALVIFEEQRCSSDCNSALFLSLSVTVSDIIFVYCIYPA